VKPGTLLAAALVLAGAGVCARLGVWQLHRLDEKRRLNAVLRAALAAPPLDLGPRAEGLAGAIGRRVQLRGRFDESRQVLLGNRAHGGSPGVEVVTPLVLADGRTAVLVERGWLYAPDAATARPQDDPEPGEVAIVGLPVAIPRGAGGPAWRLLSGSPPVLWSARTLDLDSLASRLPYALAPQALRRLPGPGVPPRPVCAAPQPLDEWMHVSYAAQWFLFGSILIGGSAALAWSRRRGATRADADPGLARRGPAATSPPTGRRS